MLKKLIPASLQCPIHFSVEIYILLLVVLYTRGLSWHFVFSENTEKPWLTLLQ